MATLKQLEEAHHLYQLRYKYKLGQGDHVEINGPHDTYGIVVSHISDVPPNSEGHLHLIRGTGSNNLSKRKNLPKL